MNRITQLILSVIAVTVLIGGTLIMDVSFPFQEYKSDSFETPNVGDSSYDDISTTVSQFLWSKRGLDVVSQSFVVLAAVVCCLAMLKYERRPE
ncbi:MAG: hypothetical protein NWE89_11495 [Candidatus Bathyarchaeota archaeon]|nr:hypothetical protein [Candidatus Bathyarchaeota archaeon]